MSVTARYTIVAAADFPGGLESGWYVVRDGAVPIVWYATDQRASADLQCALFNDPASSVEGGRARGDSQ